MKNTTLLVVVAVICVFANPSPAQEPADRKAVLVTGASSGIGQKITETLAANGFHVYAGARKDEDLARLDALDNVSAVRLDVTVDEDIAGRLFVPPIGAKGL